ncbi:MAG: hypothetical protein WAO00_19185, partial [Chthoniobacterales bacterium]
VLPQIAKWSEHDVDVRFFHKEDSELAQKIVALLRGDPFGLRGTAAKGYDPEQEFMNTSRKKAADFPHRYFEIWMTERMFR